MVKRVCLQCGRPGFDPWVGKIPWRRKWHSTPVLLPGKWQRSLVSYSPWGLKELDTTEGLHFHFLSSVTCSQASLMAQAVKSSFAMRETWVQSLGQEDPLEKGMATHSSILAWRIPWAEEPGGLQSLGSQRVRHDWATNTLTVDLLPGWPVQRPCTWPLRPELPVQKGCADSSAWQAMCRKAAPNTSIPEGCSGPGAEVLHWALHSVWRGQLALPGELCPQSWAFSFSALCPGEHRSPVCLPWGGLVAPNLWRYLFLAGI